MRNKIGKFAKQYTKEQIIKYLRGISKAIARPPVYRDLKNIPGPSPTTVIRQFGSWSNALKKAGIRPHTKQLMRGEKSFIRQNWRNMTDIEIAKKLDIPFSVIRYYRLSSNLWKNSRRGESKYSQKNKAIKNYGKRCEVCNLPLTELHHIRSKSNEIKYLAILCPFCHSLITRNIVQINSRSDLRTKLLPKIRQIYRKFLFKPSL